MTVNGTISRLEVGGAAYFAATGADTVQIWDDGRFRFRGMHLGRVSEVSGRADPEAVVWVRRLL